MARPLTAIMLAGTIRPTPLHEALDVHVLCLPVGPKGTLLDAWLDALSLLSGLKEIQVVVNSAEDVEHVSASLGNVAPRLNGATLRILAEPAAWRGAGGILRDVSANIPADHLVVVCEAKRLPPGDLTPLIRAFDERPEISGVVGVCAEDEPAGVSAFTIDCINMVPRVGYFDMKEQFLPTLARKGCKIVAAQLSESVSRLRDLESYLDAVKTSLRNNGAQANGKGTIRASDRASISGSAVLEGYCIVEPGAVIEDGAVLHDSVVLWGATVGGGAVVSRSVIGPLSDVEPRSRVVDSIIALRVVERTQKDETAFELQRVNWKADQPLQVRKDPV